MLLIIKVKEGKMGEPFGTYGRREKCMQDFGEKT
jgi:hypothetical protein